MPDDFQLLDDSNHDEETDCFLWQGPLSTDGYPVQYVDGLQRVVSRAVYARSYGELPSWVRLRRICAAPRCVHPFHHALRAPLGVARRLGWTTDDVRGIAALMRGRRQREPQDDTRWNSLNVPHLCFAPVSVADWADRLECPRLLVLAAFSVLVQADERARSRRRTAA